MQFLTCASSPALRLLFNVFRRRARKILGPRLRHGPHGEQDGEHIVSGFADLAAARAYAEARVRASVEELRRPGIANSDLRTLWHIYGQDCAVLGDSFWGHERLDWYVANAAPPSACDWTSLAPKN